MALGLVKTCRAVRSKAKRGADQGGSLIPLSYQLQEYLVFELSLREGTWVTDEYKVKVVYLTEPARQVEIPIGRQHLLDNRQKADVNSTERADSISQ